VWRGLARGRKEARTNDVDSAEKRAVISGKIWAPWNLGYNFNVVVERKTESH
jgi:hypothetical protein